MFCIVPQVFGNITDWFSAHDMVFMAGLGVVCTAQKINFSIKGFFIFCVVLANLWLVCGWFGWLMGGLEGLWLVLQLTIYSAMELSEC